MKNVLLVDDLALFRELVAGVLQRAGYQVTSAGDGQEALDRLPEAKPNVILLDLTMPVMNGVEFLRHLRADPRNAHIKVILLTATTDREALDQALAMSDAYLVKSQFSLQTLLETLQRVNSAGRGA